MRFGTGIYRSLAAAALAMYCLGSARLNGREAQGVTFVHATDPHLLVDNTNKSSVPRQRELNAGILKDLFQWMDGAGKTRGNLKGFILTGDFDADPCWLRPAGQPEPKTVDDCLKVDATWRTDQVARVATALAASPIADIYVVPGNNDIANEVATGAALAFFNKFMDDVQTQIASKNPSIHLVNLGRCSASVDDAACYADVHDTNYRLIALPSYSFKNYRPGAFLANSVEQEHQMERFARLVADAVKGGRKVIVVTHIPEIDDPFTMAQERFDAVKPTPSGGVPDTSVWSTWNVSKKVLDTWKGVLASDNVAGVLAGHLHDSHKEIYRQPYPWATSTGYRDFRKLFLAPPLAVKYQDASPIQARGFSLVHLQAQALTTELYWYEDQSHTFVADQSQAPPLSRSRVVEALRHSWDLVAPQTLGRLSVLFIALLAAFLTVVRVWQLPPPDSPFASSPVTSTPPASSTTTATAVGGPAPKTPTALPSPAFDPSPFASNFGKTVIFGLGGLVASTVLESLGVSSPAADDRQFYIVWFIFLFFILLVTSSVFRGGIEAVRARVTVLYRPAPRCSDPVTESESWTDRSGLGRRRRARWSWMHRVSGWSSYWMRRFIGWLRSWQVPMLTFADTVINSIQGKNQTRTQALSKLILEQHRNVLRVTEAIRARLNDTIVTNLRASNPELAEGDVRVNISVVSADESVVFYIATAPGSAVKEFGKRSIAWISAFAGKIRWFKETFRTNDLTGDRFRRIVLFDNSSDIVVGDERKILLASHYQERAQDYAAFVVFPVPWPQRSVDGTYVKGAIHVSFRTEGLFDSIWRTPALDETGPTGDILYAREDLLLRPEGCPSPEVRAVLRDALIVVGEVLRGFNENIYRGAGGPDQML